MIKAVLQGSSPNLDTMRGNSPSLPPSYQSSSTFPPATYDDPKPTNSANFDAYMTGMPTRANATGIAGSLPLQAADTTAGSASVGGWSYNLDSGNYNFTAPVPGLPGRAGLGLGLALSYNNKVWSKVNSTMLFNADQGSVAPGWQLSFGYIRVKSQATPGYSNSTTGKQSLIYVTPDGTRHDLAAGDAGATYYLSYDSSYLRYETASQILKFPNGTRITFGATGFGSGEAKYLPTLIKDRNGNFINIYYKNLTILPSAQKTVIDYVIDTAGRRIDFNYTSNRLTSVSQNRGGTNFYYAYIDYQPVTLQVNFGALTLDPSNIHNTVVYLPSRITYPTGVNLRFYYTSYGQIFKIEKWVPTITGQDNARVIAYTRFTLPTYDPNYSQSNSPTFDFRYEWAENWQGGTEVAYRYYYWETNGHKILDPLGRIFRVWVNGLVHQTALHPGVSTNFSKQDTLTYIKDSGVSYESNPRVQQSETISYDQETFVSSTRTSTFEYTQLDGMWLPSVKKDYQLGAVYRQTSTDYTSYPAQYILGLPSQISTYAGAGTTLLARVTNSYDETSSYTDSNNQSAPYFIDAGSDGVIQHDNTNYGAGFTQRGNLTSVTQSSVVAGSITGSRIVKRISYDTNGNVRADADGAANRKQLSYADNYFDKPGGVGQTGVAPTLTQDPTGFGVGAQVFYYTGNPRQTYNKRVSGSPEQIVETSYDFADRPLQTTRPDGGWVKTEYWDNWLAAEVSQQIESGKIRYKFEAMDGAGRPYRKASDHPDGVSGVFSGQFAVFNKVGQTQDSSNVAKINGSWTPQGESFLWTNLTRDELSRLKIVTHPDNNTKQYDYDGCGCGGNSETRMTNELGHYTVTRTDFLGRLVEAKEPLYSNPALAYSKAVYIYNELDQLTQIQHSNSSGNTQYRYFSYDGYARLSSENTPEGGIVNYTYTANDLPLTNSNQRNITVTNSYNTRNLLTGVSYSDGTPGAGYVYDEYGARSQMNDGEGATGYVYNSYRQLQSETRTFTALSGYSYLLNYTYSQGDQLKSVNYQVTYGNSPGNPLTKPPFGSSTQPPYTISGTVKDQQNQPVSGVTVTLTGTQSGQTTTNSSGQHSFSGLAAGDYTLTPSKSGLVFNPSSITYPGLSKNRIDANFTALPALQTLFNKTINYAYNTVGALSGVGTNLIGSDPNATTNVANTLTFRASGAIKTVSFGNDRKLIIGYNDNRQQPTSMKVERISNSSGVLAAKVP